VSSKVGSLITTTLGLKFPLVAIQKSSFVSTKGEALGAKVIGKHRYFFLVGGHPGKLASEKIHCVIGTYRNLGECRSSSLMLYRNILEMLQASSQHPGSRPHSLGSWLGKHRDRPTEQLLTMQQEFASISPNNRLLLQCLPGVFHLEPSCIRTLTKHALSNSSLPIYFAITDSLPLKLVYLLAGVTDDSDSEPC
jgi:hypothetical protein